MHVRETNVLLVKITLQLIFSFASDAAFLSYLSEYELTCLDFDASDSMSSSFDGVEVREQYICSIELDANE